MKNSLGFFIALIIVLSLCIGCSIFGDEYDHLHSVEQSGEMICIVKKRLSAELKIRKPLTKAELFRFGVIYKPEEFPDLVVRNCSPLNNRMMLLSADR